MSSLHNIRLSADTVAPSAHSRGPRLWRKLLSNWPASLSFVWIVGLAVASLLAPLLLKHTPLSQDYAAILQAPSWDHWLGTDDLGRDTLSRLLHGARLSLYASMVAVSVALVLGLPAGIAAGFLGSTVDLVVSRIIDTLMSFPSIVLAIAVTSALGIGLTNSMIALGFVFSPIIARIARAQTLVVRNEPYVEVARGFGASELHLAIRHVLPNAIQPVLVQVALLLAAALLAEAGMSFVGLGVQPPQPSWGSMIARAYGYVQTSPLQMVMPGVAIMMTALAFNTIGEYLRIRLDPKTRGT